MDVTYHDAGDNATALDRRTFVVGGFVHSELANNGLRLNPPIPSRDWGDKTGWSRLSFDGSRWVRPRPRPPSTPRRV